MALMAGMLSAQVTLKRGAVVYFGSAANTTAPATIDLDKVKSATEQWQKIEADGIDPDSARGKQLIQEMNKVIREAVKSIARDESRDLVVREKDITDDQGREVVDLTKKVVEKIEE
ncbi:MAG: hypothetical protein KDE27_21510 [Planctomycetes bacterium]|nr:hypothetical protein [Planctomycetota bacterium]